MDQLAKFMGCLSSKAVFAFLGLMSHPRPVPFTTRIPIKLPFASKVDGQVLNDQVGKYLCYWFCLYRDAFPTPDSTENGKYGSSASITMENE